MRTELRMRLLALRQRDEQVRDELSANGSLYDGYHPRMEEVHRQNALQLRTVIDEVGWPNEELAGPDGAEAAWLVAQHAIGEPDFMRNCRTLLEEASSQGKIPMWQFAYIDDRIRVYEGKPQHFGTQIDLRPDGAVVSELESPQEVDSRRREIGLPPLAIALARFQGNQLPSSADYVAKEEAGRLWRQKVGWLA